MEFNSKLTAKLGPFNPGVNSWLDYQNRMDKFFDENDVWSSEKKKSICVSMIGSKALAILRKLSRPQTIQDLDYETVLEKFESHFYPTLSQKQHRFKFNQRTQKKSESFFSYVAALYKLILTCNYVNREDCLRRKIIDGVREDLKKQLIDADNLTLTCLFEIGLSYDNERSIKPVPHPRNHKARKNREKTCFRCKESIVKKHIMNECCPFEWAKCQHCHIKGHISVACKYKDFICNYCSQKGHIVKTCDRKIEDESGPRILAVSVSLQPPESKTNDAKVLCISNLRINTTVEQIKDYFRKYGEIKSLIMQEDANTNKFVGVANISYKHSKSYKKVLGAKNDHSL